jgi:hypothetical protein
LLRREISRSHGGGGCGGDDDDGLLGCDAVRFEVLTVVMVVMMWVVTS